MKKLGDRRECPDAHHASGRGSSRTKMTCFNGAIALACAALAALTIAVPGAAGAAIRPGGQGGHDPALAIPHSLAPAGTWTVGLTANPAVISIAEESTVTATANADVGPTPYYLRIYDYTTQTYISTCSSHTTCQGLVPWNGGTIVRRGAHTPGIARTAYDTVYALISDNSAAYPPGNIQATAVIRVGMIPDFIYCPPPPGRCQ